MTQNVAYVVHNIIMYPKILNNYLGKYPPYVPKRPLCTKKLFQIYYMSLRCPDATYVTKFGVCHCMLTLSLLTIRLLTLSLFVSMALYAYILKYATVISPL